jgi:hypothetical protein
VAESCRFFSKSWPDRNGINDFYENGDYVLPISDINNTYDSLLRAIFKNRRLRIESEHNTSGHREPALWAIRCNRLLDVEIYLSTLTYQNYY